MAEIRKQHQKVLEISGEQMAKDQMFSKVPGLSEAGSGLRI